VTRIKNALRLSIVKVIVPRKPPETNVWGNPPVPNNTMAAGTDVTKMMMAVTASAYRYLNPDGMTRMKKERITGAKMAMFSIWECKVKEKKRDA
jgi:hypothetical protein